MSGSGPGTLVRLCRGLRFWVFGIRGPRPQRPEQVRIAIRGAIIRALVKWGGETAIGFVPLFAHYLLVTTSSLFDSELHKPPLDEFNIVTVVISGLGLISLFELDPPKSAGNEGLSRYFTPFTFIVAILALLLLIGGSLLYAVSSGGKGVPQLSSFTFVGLGLAAFVSAFLAVERSWLEAVDRATHGALTKTVKES